MTIQKLYFRDDEADPAYICGDHRGLLFGWFDDGEKVEGSSNQGNWRVEWPAPGSPWRYAPMCSSPERLAELPGLAESLAGLSGDADLNQFCAALESAGFVNARNASRRPNFDQREKAL